MTDGYNAATWRRQVIRELAFDLNVSDARAALVASRMTDADLREYLRRSLMILLRLLDERAARAR